MKEEVDRAVPPTEPNAAASDAFALVIQMGKSKPESTLSAFLRLLLSYQYGLEVVMITDQGKLSETLRKRGTSIHSVYLVQDQLVSTRSTVPALSAKGRIPLFLLLPGHLARQQSGACAGLAGVHVGAWEMAFSKGEESLARIVLSGLAETSSADVSSTPTEERVR